MSAATRSYCMCVQCDRMPSAHINLILICFIYEYSGCFAWGERKLRMVHMSTRISNNLFRLNVNAEFW